MPKSDGGATASSSPKKVKTAAATAEVEASPTKKAKTDEPPVNKELADMFLELADYEKNVQRQIHKFNAYKKAAGSILHHANKITCGKDAMSLEGVGKKIADKIDEFVQKGQISRLEKARHDDNTSIAKELTRVTGIGPAAAHKFIEEGIKSLDDLRKNLDKLNHHQQIGLKYVEDFEKRIPREEMLKWQELVLKEIAAIDKEYVAIVCGSFRRGAATSGDIDVLVTHPTYTSSSKKTKKQNEHVTHVANIVQRLAKDGYITDTLALGDFKFMGVCRLNKTSLFRRIDIRLIPHDQYYCGLLYFTGSDEFNKHMRTVAIEKNFMLNEYSIRKTNAKGVPIGEPLKVTCEEDIFKYLGMEYKRPEERS